MNKFKIAQEVVNDYNKEFIEGKTMLHIQEWIQEKIDNTEIDPEIMMDVDDDQQIIKDLQATAEELTTEDYIVFVDKDLLKLYTLNSEGKKQFII